MKHGADAEILFAYSAEEVFAAVPNVKWVQTSGAGIEKQLYPAMMKSGAAFTNAAGVYAPQAAEHAFALLLALTRGLGVSHTASGEARMVFNARLRSGDWRMDARRDRNGRVRSGDGEAGERV